MRDWAEADGYHRGAWYGSTLLWTMTFQIIGVRCVFKMGERTDFGELGWTWEPSWLTPSPPEE